MKGQREGKKKATEREKKVKRKRKGVKYEEMKRVKERLLK